MLSNNNIETKNETFLSTSQKNIHEILFFIKIPQRKKMTSTEISILNNEIF